MRALECCFRRFVDRSLYTEYEYYHMRMANSSNSCDSRARKFTHSSIMYSNSLTLSASQFNSLINQLPRFEKRDLVIVRLVNTGCARPTCARAAHNVSRSNGRERDTLSCVAAWRRTIILMQKFEEPQRRGRKAETRSLLSRSAVIGIIDCCWRSIACAALAVARCVCAPQCATHALRLRLAVVRQRAHSVHLAICVWRSRPLVLFSSFHLPHARRDDRTHCTRKNRFTTSQDHATPDARPVMLFSLILDMKHKKWRASGLLGSRGEERRGEESVCSKWLHLRGPELYLLRLMMMIIIIFIVHSLAQCSRNLLEGAVFFELKALRQTSCLSSCFELLTLS